MIVRSSWTCRMAVVALALGFVVAPTATTTATAAPVKDTRACTYDKVPTAPTGKIARDDSIQPRHDPLASWRAANKSQVRAAQAAGSTVTVPVAFHVIRKNATLAGGDVPKSQIVDQVAVLNAAYAGTGFRFVLDHVTRTTQPQWFNLIPANGDDRRLFRGSGKEVKMKQELHEGGAETLNIYTAALGQFLLGWAYLPSDFMPENGGLPRFYDGVVLDYRSLPGGSLTIYNEGDTGTHEVGHWLGLLHTFDGGCTAPGDFVEDTPFEATPSFECEVGRDTCPQPGTDPITNFMDYTPDACMNEFTDGQAARMRESWTAYRT
jgi:hypothetical protein